MTYDPTAEIDNPMEEPLTEPDPTEPVPGENPEAVRSYLEASAVRAVITQGGEKFCLSQWRKHNAQCGWLKTIEYPPQTTETLGADLLREVLAEGFIDRVVAFLLRGKKFWSINSAARQAVQLAGARVFDRLVHPPQVPTPKPTTKAPTKMSAKTAAGVK